MYNATLPLEKLEQIDEALAGIELYTARISSPFDFLDSENGVDMMEKITVTLISIGENFKKMDRDTEGKKLAQRYPDVNWSGIKGVCDILLQASHSISTPGRFSTFVPMICSLCALLYRK